MMRDYLKDFWRHEVEKAEGEARLWQTITSNRNWWWASISEVRILCHQISYYGNFFDLITSRSILEISDRTEGVIETEDALAADG